MGRKWPVDDIPEPSSDMPEGAFLFEVEKFEEQQTKNGRLMITGTYRCVEPEEFAGRLHFERYTIGSDNDPNAEEPETFKKSFGAQNLRKHLNLAKVKASNDMDKMLASATGHKLILAFREKIDNREFNKDGSANQYFGETRVRLTAAFLEGAVPLGEGTGKPKAKAAAKPAAAVVKKPARDEDDDAKPAASKGKKAADYDDDEDDD